MGMDSGACFEGELENNVDGKGFPMWGGQSLWTFLERDLHERTGEKETTVLHEGTEGPKLKPHEEVVGVGVAGAPGPRAEEARELCGHLFFHISEGLC